MDRTAFDHLYLHAHALAELAFARSLARVLDAPPPTFTDAERADLAANFDAALNATEETFNWAALDGIGEAAPEPSNDPPAAPGPSFDEALASVQDPDGELTPDPARYLHDVYAARPALEPRLAHLWAHADRPALAGLLAAVTSQAEPLTGRLSAEGWQAWLAAYEAHDPALEALVAAVRTD